MTNKKKGKWSIWKAIRNMFIFLDVAVVILSAGYIVARIYDYYASVKAYKTIEEIYVTHPLEMEDLSTPETDSAVRKEEKEDREAVEPQGTPIPERPHVDWEGLRTVNPDLVAWIYVPMAGISYPVVQGTDNDEYLHKAFTGEYRYAGSIFLDSENTKDFTDRNTILYGHNMRDGSMFAMLNNLTADEFRNEPWIWVLTPRKAMLYKSFSYHTGETEGSSYTLFSPYMRHEEFPDWLNALLKGSTFDGQLPGRYYERVLTLSTCTSRSYTERMILQGILVREVPEG